MTYWMDLKEIQERRRRLNGLLFYFYYLSMKTLAESLFDKDLAQQELNLGTQYAPKNVYIIDDSRFTDVSYDEEDVKWLGTILKVPALKRDIKPYPATEVESYKDKRFHKVTEIGCYLIPIILQFPPLTHEPSYNEALYSNLIYEKIFEPYIKKSNKIDRVEIKKHINNHLVFSITVLERKRIDGEMYTNRKYFEISFVEK